MIRINTKTNRKDYAVMTVRSVNLSPPMGV